MPVDRQKLNTAIDALSARLLDACVDGSHWEGMLSSSALSTAVAVFALGCLGDDGDDQACRRGCEWLCENINTDGSWGDTPISRGNLSTSLLAWSALSSQEPDFSRLTPVIALAGSWIEQRLGSLTPEAIVTGILAHYGGDRTFSIPILTLCALAGRLGPPPGCWQRIPQLPYELGILPHGLCAAAGLPVVSYALPALIAMGVVREHFAPGRLGRLSFRRLLRGRALSRLARIQPANGGFLEAAPLTGFVGMSLAGAGFGDTPTALQCARFLRKNQRPDGSWPIDTNLATWLTSLSVDALGDRLPVSLGIRIRDWLLNRQFTAVHPYTGARPGGWAWTDLPGGVPDADDTSGALLALRQLSPGEEGREAADAGIHWLLALRNRDGGMPTFCRGWGRLPFDRSCPDITAHAIGAFTAWLPDLPAGRAEAVRKALDGACAYLRSSQRHDGAWNPLWFGNERAEGHRNPVYGTSRVLVALGGLRRSPQRDTMIEKGIQFLHAAQNTDGSWGGDRGIPGSIEETALALHGLTSAGPVTAAVRNGCNWLVEQVQDRTFQAAPIGLYFASLWYYEELYPAIFSLRALRQVLRCGRQ